MGTGQYNCRDIMTMFFWPKCVSLLYYCYILCGYYIPVYVDTVALTFLELVLSLKLYSTLSRCRFVVVAKVKNNCRVPSSAQFSTFNQPVLHNDTRECTVQCTRYRSFLNIFGHNGKLNLLTVFRIRIQGLCDLKCSHNNLLLKTLCL